MPLVPIGSVYSGISTFGGSIVFPFPSVPLVPIGSVYSGISKLGESEGLTPPENSGFSSLVSGTPFSLLCRTTIVTDTSSTVPSGYVTNATVGWLPGVFTTGVSFHVTLVPSGKPVLSTLSSAFGTVPLSTVCGFGCGS